MKLSFINIQTIFFIVCIVPFSIGDGITANYLFALEPLFVIFFINNSNLKLIKNSYRFFYGFVFLMSLLLIFLFSPFFNSFNYGTLVSIAGAIIFGLTYILPVYIIDKGYKLRLLSLIRATILFSLFKFTEALLNLYFLAGDSLTLAKNFVGSNRIGFIYTFLIFYLLSIDLKRWQEILSLNKKYPLLILGFTRNILIFLLVAASILTFSKATLISLCSTFFVFLIMKVDFKTLFKKIVYLLKKIKKRRINLIFWYSILLGFTYSLFKEKIANLFADISTVIYLFFELQIFNYMFSSEGLGTILERGNTGGDRITLMERSFEYLLNQPILGSLYRAPSLIFDTSDLNLNSYHNQYLDIIVRSGMILGPLVLIFLFYLLWVAYKTNKDLNLFFPFLSIFIYGLFHETFRESQGAFILYSICIILLSHIYVFRLRQNNGSNYT